MKSRRLSPLFFLRQPANARAALRATLFLCGAATLGLAFPLATYGLFGWVVPQTDFLALGWLGIGMLSAVLAGTALEWVGGRNWLCVGERAERHWVPIAWARLAAMPFRWLHDAGPVESGARAQAVHETILRAMEWLPRLQAAAVAALANVLFLFFIHRFLAIVGVLCALGAGLILMALNQRRTRALVEEFQFAETLHAEALGWMRHADAFRLAGAWESVQARAEHWMDCRLEARKKAGKGDVWRTALFIGATALPCLILFAAVDQTDLDMAPFLAFLVAFGALVGSLRILADGWPVLAEARALVHRAQPLWETPRTFREGKLITHELQGRLEMEGIHFRYSPEFREILKDFSLRIEAGEWVGLTGPPGCGKSTVIKLLAGLEFPEAGRIWWDQQDLASWDPDRLRAQMGIVWQRGDWYSGSLLRNIVGESEHALEEAWHAAETAGLADDIRALPMQMHTWVAEGAANFSAGQRQRILIARALTRRPRILFLDEATRSLDRSAHLRLMESLAKLRITCVVISSQAAGMTGADRVIQMNSVE